MSDAYLAEAGLPRSPSTIGLTWFLKRTAIAILILGFGMGAIAWLMHASIEPAVQVEDMTTHTAVPNASGAIGAR